MSLRIDTIIQKQSPVKALRKSCSEKVHKKYREKPVSKLKRDSDAGLFL